MNPQTQTVPSVRSTILALLVFAAVGGVLLYVTRSAWSHTPHTDTAAAIQAFQPGVVVEDVAPAPMKGWQQASIGTQVLYVSDDGRYALSGTLLDLKARRNLTELVQIEIAARILANASKQPLHVYKAQAEPVGRIYVFTDPTCSYCTKLHKELPELQARGVEVVYLAFPRGGVDSPGYAPLAAAICREDRSAALDQAFGGVPMEAVPCPNALLDHYRAGERLQLSGTPGIFAEDGRQLGGYLSPDQLVAALAAKPGHIPPRGAPNGQ